MGAVISLSGGMDSAVLLSTLCLHSHKHTLAITFDYGSKHGMYEQAAAIALAKHYGVSHLVVDVRGLFFGCRSNLLALKGPIPEGHYQHESMRLTVVPGRNLIFAAVLSSIAESHGLDRVYLGVHAGDHAIYPDCRPPFINALKEAVTVSSEGKVKIEAPFLHMDKAQIVLAGLQSRIPFGMTRTCYKDQPTACGKCGSCQERLEAFKLNGVEDPIEYESREIMPKGAS